MNSTLKAIKKRLALLQMTAWQNVALLLLRLTSVAAKRGERVSSRLMTLLTHSATDTTKNNIICLRKHSLSKKYTNRHSAENIEIGKE